jgi:hypothetical protein
MQLYRLDATHDAGDGEFVKFYRDRATAAIADRRFSTCGWLCDFYPVELNITAVTARRLLDGVWPNETADQLLALVGDPLTQAAVDLDAIEERKQTKRRNAR